MTSHHPHHETEWVYSTILTKKLSPLNVYIHELPSVPHPAELFIASCGYAFNPVMFPCWPILIYALSYKGLSSDASTTTTTTPFSRELNKWLQWTESEHHNGALINTALYLATVVITLAFTEIGKASLATTRPQPPLGGYDTNEWRRRYGKLVASLKSKHSFPSGDCAQAMNLCMFLWRYVPIENFISVAGNDISITLVLFGIFLPITLVLFVAFARVFYRCHWIEDCFGGIILSLVLHRTLIPAISKVLPPEMFSMALAA
ncbi:hypothetical protein ACHAXR_012989 [Thalassiosira sp. AJA248-18]